MEQSSRKPVFQRDKTPSHWRKRDANRPLSVRKNSSEWRNQPVGRPINVPIPPAGGGIIPVTDLLAGKKSSEWRKRDACHAVWCGSFVSEHYVTCRSRTIHSLSLPEHRATPHHRHDIPDMAPANSERNPFDQPQSESGESRKDCNSNEHALAS